MAGILAHIPNDKPRFLPASSELLACCAAEAVTFVRRLLSSSFGCEDEDEDSFRVLFRERELDEKSAASLLKTLAAGQLCVVRVLFRLLGGKGGFGALLRKQANRGKKTTNLDAMRDLSGQRLRHSTAVERIKNWMEKKVREDELVNLIAGEGPELPTKAPENDSLDPEFVRKLKRSSADRPAAVAAGMRALEGGSEEPAKRLRTSTSTASSGVSSSKSGADWPGMFSALGTLSSPSQESSEEEPAVSASAAAASTTDSFAQGSMPASSSCSAAAASASSSAAAACAAEVDEEPRSAAAACAAEVDEEPLTVPVAAASSVAEATARSATAVEPEGDAHPEAEVARASAGDSTTNGSAANSAPEVEPELLQPEDAAKFASAADLLGKVSADVLKKSLQQIGLKCGGKPEDRAARFMLLKDTPLKDLPKAAFAAK